MMVGITESWEIEFVKETLLWQSMDHWTTIPNASWV